MREYRALLLAALFFLLALLKLLLPGQTENLRSLVGEGIGQGLEEKVEAWGRSLSGDGDWVAVLGREDNS